MSSETSGISSDTASETESGRAATPVAPTEGSGRPPAVRASGVGKRYRIGRTEGLFRYRSLREELAGAFRRRSDGEAERWIWALREVDLEIREGETVGIIGRNGAGKSTLLKILSGITPPTEGRAEVWGRVGSLLEVGTGFHPELTGRDNIFLSGAVLGMRKSEIRRKVEGIVEFAGIGRFLHTPVKRYSSGMYLRLAFSVAAHLEPDILVVDEVLAVGDASFQKKCLGRMTEIGSEGRTVLFVSHSMPAVMRICQRAILLDAGRVVADGPVGKVVHTYLDSGLGTSARRQWPGPDEAPGDDVARLKAVTVRDQRGDVTDDVDITQALCVEVEYWHLTDDPAIRPCATLRFVNEDGVGLFSTKDLADAEWTRAPRQPGVVRSTCHIPGNFLAEGKIYVWAGVHSINPNVVHALEPDAVAFQVVDRSRGEGVRGEFVGEWPGVVRPTLAWDVELEAGGPRDGQAE